MIDVVMTAKDVDAEKAFFVGKLGFQGIGYKLSLPGTPGETVELKPRVPGETPELRFAADPKRAAEELKKRAWRSRSSAASPRSATRTARRFTSASAEASSVAHALMRAASRLFSTRLLPGCTGRRQECRRGTQECVRHIFLQRPIQPPSTTSTWPWT